MEEKCIFFNWISFQFDLNLYLMRTQKKIKKQFHENTILT